MKKVSVTVAFLLAMSGFAFAHTKTVPVPPKRPADLVQVKPDGAVVVTAPKDVDVDVDVDGRNVTVTVDKPESEGLSSVLPWNWSVWH